jgi:coenzyme F420-reducing hydrogenase delta subunit
MVFGCNHAFDIAALKAPNLAVLSFFCTGQMPPTLVEYALKNGADGVFIVGCRTGDCYFRYGNVWLDKRFEGDRKPILRSRADRTRIVVSRAAETDGKKLRRELAAFQHTIATLKREETGSAHKEAGHA